MLAAMSMHENCHGGRPVGLRLRGSGDAHGRGDAYGTVPYGSGDARQACRAHGRFDAGSGDTLLLCGARRY